MKKIFGELSRIQQELKAPKNLYNSFGKYKYRNAEGILEAVKPILNGYALIINDEPILIGDRFYIKATVTLTDGEEEVSAVAYAREDETKKGMDGCQITGACSSYARKYALNALLMIDDSKDSDDDSMSPKNPANSMDELPPPESNAKPFTAPKTKQDAQVSKPAKVPANENPVKKFIDWEIEKLRADYGITDKDQMLMRFISMRDSLIKGGVIEDIASANMTMEQAKEMIDAIRKNFPPVGESA